MKKVSRRQSLKDIAEKSAVSVSTVSRVLNDTSTVIPVSQATRNKVLKIAQEMGYRPNIFARSLRTSRSNMIGVLANDITDPFAGQVLEGIDTKLTGAGFRVLLSNARGEPAREIESVEELEDTLVEGIIIIGARSFFGTGQSDRVRSSSIPIVLVGSYSEHPDVLRVTVDNHEGGVVAAQYLRKLGRPIFAFACANQHLEDFDERIRGFTETLGSSKNGARCRIVKTAMGEGGGFAGMKKILRNARAPLSLFALDDETAIGAIRAARDKGMRIPEDVAIVGFDDLPIAEFFEPRLTTIRQPSAEMGAKAAELLISAIRGGTEEAAREQLVLKPRLIVRKSA